MNYSAPVLSFSGQERLREICIMHPRVMRIILGCQRNVRIEIMKAGLGLKSIQINALSATLIGEGILV